MSDDTYMKERANCKNIPDHLVMGRISLFLRIKEENELRLSAARAELGNRYPHIEQNLKNGQEIEEAVKQIGKKPNDSRESKQSTGFRNAPTLASGRKDKEQE